MKLIVKRVETYHNGDISQLGTYLIENKVGKFSLETLNWAADYPYKPRVEVEIAHTGDEILLHFDVSERDVRAVCNTDNGRSWEDSCVEFFLQPDVKSPLYYNFEFTCAGYKLIGGGLHGTERGRADMSLHQKVITYSSLGASAFGQRYGQCSWELSAVIPKETLYLSEIESLSKRIMKGNFYKCGDLQPTPHFLSWTKIGSPKPQFHLPQYFGELEFE